MEKRLFITWSPKNRLKSVNDLANIFKAKIYTIHYLRHEQPIFAPIKYPLQILKTITILFKENPNVIFVMNPPIFAPLFVYFWAKLKNAKLIINSHTGAFFSNKWRWSLSLHKLLSLNSLLTITPDRISASIVSEWGANFIVLEDKIHEFCLNLENNQFEIQKNKKYKIAVINTFSGDEPIDEILEAAKILPEYEFYITGEILKGKRFVKRKLKNVIFTGFLIGTSYSDLILSADICLVLTNEKNALLAGALDALSIGKPLITTNWTIMREYFSSGTVFVNNTPDDIVNGIKYTFEVKEQLVREMRYLKNQKSAQWMIKINKIEELIRSN